MTPEEKAVWERVFPDKPDVLPSHFARLSLGDNSAWSSSVSMPGTSKYYGGFDNQCTCAAAPGGFLGSNEGNAIFPNYGVTYFSFEDLSKNRENEEQRAMAETGAASHSLFNAFASGSSAEIDPVGGYHAPLGAVPYPEEEKKKRQQAKRKNGEYSTSGLISFQPDPFPSAVDAITKNVAGLQLSMARKSRGKVAKPDSGATRKNHSAGANNAFHQHSRRRSGEFVDNRGRALRDLRTRGEMPSSGYSCKDFHRYLPYSLTVNRAKVRDAKNPHQHADPRKQRTRVRSPAVPNALSSPTMYQSYLRSKYIRDMVNLMLGHQRAPPECFMDEETFYRWVTRQIYLEKHNREMKRS